MTDGRYEHPVDLALAFVNTGSAVHTRRNDPLATPDGVIRWLAEHVAPPEDAAARWPWAPPLARQLQMDALRLRDAIHELVEHTAAGQALPGAPLDEMDRVLDAATWSRHIVAEGGRVRLVDQSTASRPLGVLAPIALSAVELASVAGPDRLRQCDAADCARWFLDTSKGGRRRWCSMATCGNRAKAARWRDRHAP